MGNVLLVEFQVETIVGDRTSAQQSDLQVSRDEVKQSRGQRPI